MKELIEYTNEDFSEEILDFDSENIEYDPHLLYHAINITVELQYRLPMKQIYLMLEDINKKNKKVSPSDLMELLKTLNKELDKKLDEDENPDGTNGKSTKERIKELLRLLNCSLSNEDLNKILKGELSIDSVLSDKAKILWKLVFDQEIGEKPRPNVELINQMMWSVQKLEIEEIEQKIEQATIEKNLRNKAMQNAEYLTIGNIKTQKLIFNKDQEKQKKERDPVELENKRRKLKLYIAHMQGYDRDRDGDGARGIDSYGNIIDYDDIYIADKEHGCVIEDIDHDGIEREDLK